MKAINNDFSKNGDVLLGEGKVLSAELEMVGMREILKFAGATILSKVPILACVTPTPQTGAFFMALKRLGADVVACSDNRFATDDDVVAYLNSQGIPVFAKANMSLVEYYKAMDLAIDLHADKSNVQIVDDGCDITTYIAKNRPKILQNVRAITEQTTCGINFLKTLYKEELLPVPAVNINHSYIKKWFDNYIGIQQSLIHAFSSSHISIAGKKVAVIGFGAVGKGAAKALRCNGVSVGVVDKDITMLMQAQLEGYDVISLAQALRDYDICITATGCINTITLQDIENSARNGLMLINVGHGDREYCYEELAALKTRTLNPHIDITTLQDGREILSLCKGALFNFLAGGGNPSAVMGLTFTLELLAHAQIARGEYDGAGNTIHRLSADTEKNAVELNFPHLVNMQAKLSHAQELYMHE